MSCRWGLIAELGYESVPYTQFLHEKFQISSGKLQDAIVYAIAMGDAQSKQGSWYYQQQKDETI